MKVRLTGKTQHGKNRVREHGTIWHVENEIKGELFLRSEADGDVRWVARDNDPNFDVHDVSKCAYCGKDKDPTPGMCPHCGRFPKW